MEMLQAHFPWRPADKKKLADFEDSWPSEAYVKNHPGISVVVMQQVKMKGRQLNDSPAPLDKYLRDI